VLSPVFISIPTAIIFKVPPVNIAILSLIPYAWNYLAHANINLGFGPLWWFLVSPNYHRVHHSLLPEHIDRNFANWFPIWDIMFGTAVRPRWSKCPSTGVAGVAVQSLGQAYWLPFQGWLRMMSRSGRRDFVAPSREQTLPPA
jgi:sterol desaturase/sphingolipid hydroxylase (fatty acid hydroxylase superfamily)